MILTKLVWEPQVICKEVGHVVIQLFQHVQGIVNEEDGVIVAVQHPFEVVIAMKVSSQEWGDSCPADMCSEV